MSTYSEEERRRAEKRIEAIRRGQGGDLRGIYKGIAIDLQCRLNELERLVQRARREFLDILAWHKIETTPLRKTELSSIQSVLNMLPAPPETEEE